MRLDTSDSVLSSIGRVSCGYHSTKPDGECGVTSVLQTLLLTQFDLVGEPITVESAFAQADAAGPQARQRIEAAFNSNDRTGDRLRQLLPDAKVADYLQHHYNSHVSNIKLPDGGMNWKVMASLYGKPRMDDGIWLNEVALRAYAVLLKRNILVVPTSGCIFFYPKETGTYLRPDTGRVERTDLYPCIYCVGFIPECAFSPDTIVICHNMENHFWCTRMSPSSPDWNHLKFVSPLPIRKFYPIT